MHKTLWLGPPATGAQIVALSNEYDCEVVLTEPKHEDHLDAIGRTDPQYACRKAEKLGCSRVVFDMVTKDEPVLASWKKSEDEYLLVFIAAL